MPENVEPPIQRVQIVDIKVPFYSLVGLMVKFVIATIPAALIIVFLVIAAGALFRAI